MDDNILQKIEDNKQFRVISGKQCSTFESKKQYYQPKHE